MAYGVINGWKMQDPLWETYSRNICTKEHHWYGIYISSFYIDRDRRDRIWASFPNIAEHFYYVHDHRDCFFASYDIEEVKRFIMTVFPERLWTAQFAYWVYDAVTKSRLDNKILFAV